MDDRYKALITQGEELVIEPERKILEDAGAEVVAVQCNTEQDVIDNGRDADAVMVGGAKISRKVIESLDRCKVIVRYGIGVDAVDVKAATECGICIANVPDFCFDEVSDTAMSLILATVRKVVMLNNAIKGGTWDRGMARPIHKIRGSTLGIIGFGNIARALVRKAIPFGFKVIAYDPYLSDDDVADYPVKLVDLNYLLENSDVISIHTPLTDETWHMIGEEKLRRMKSSAYLINTSRGAVVDGQALYRALKEGWIAGAGLDVIEGEPLRGDEPILELENVVLTPHYASYTEEAYYELRIKAAEGAAQALRGEFPRYLVNPEVKERPDCRLHA